MRRQGVQFTVLATVLDWWKMSLAATPMKWTAVAIKFSWSQLLSLQKDAGFFFKDTYCGKKCSYLIVNEWERFGANVALLCKGPTLGQSCEQLCVFASAEGECRLTTRIFVLRYFFSIMEISLIHSSVFSVLNCFEYKWLTQHSKTNNNPTAKIKRSKSRSSQWSNQTKMCKRLPFLMCSAIVCATCVWMFVNGWMW